MAKPKDVFPLTSPAFDPGATIPREYTADGLNVSPPLRWADVPEGTKAFALLCEDPDAPRGLWIHWVAFNIPAGTRELAADLPTVAKLSDGTEQGLNSFGNVGYGGPSPPPGAPHRYVFHVYALDMRLDLSPNVSRDGLITAMGDHVLAEGELIGLYGRS